VASGDRLGRLEEEKSWGEHHEGNMAAFAELYNVDRWEDGEVNPMNEAVQVDQTNIKLLLFIYQYRLQPQLTEPHRESVGHVPCWWRLSIVMENPRVARFKTVIATTSVVLRPLYCNFSYTPTLTIWDTGLKWAPFQRANIEMKWKSTCRDNEDTYLRRLGILLKAFRFGTEVSVNTIHGLVW